METKNAVYYFAVYCFFYYAVRFTFLVDKSKNGW